MKGWRWLVCTSFAAALVAQRENPVLLLGRHLINITSFAEVATLPSAHGLDAAFALRRADGTFQLDQVLVDAHRRQQVSCVGGVVRLSELDGRELWAQRSTPGAFVGELALERAVLARRRIVLPGIDGGLSALDRATGAVVWSCREGENTLVVGDETLVVAAGSIAAGGELRAHAIDNGAKAFAVALPTEPQAVVLAPHGVAVVCGTSVLVFDRSGPLRFELPLLALSVVAHANGWFVITRNTVFAFDREGNERWNIAREQNRFEQDATAVDAEGRLLLARYGSISDSGALVTCHDQQTGTVLWQRQVPGLGVSHSKYWHRVQVLAFGGLVVVTSQAAGGCFLVALELDDGAQRARVTPAQ